jgi:DNA gyrase subunit A
LSVRDEDEVMFLTVKGQSVRTRVREIRETGRGAKGVKLLTLADGDRLLSIARVVETDPTADSADPAIVTPPAPTPTA